MISHTGTQHLPSSTISHTWAQHITQTYTLKRYHTRALNSTADNSCFNNVWHLVLKTVFQAEHLILMVAPSPIAQHILTSPSVQGAACWETLFRGQPFIPNLSGPIYFSFVPWAQWPNLFFIYLPRGHRVGGMGLACYLIHHQGYLKAISTVPCHGLI